ncbi:MAG: hypothetical protein JWP04_2782 [Belnapia sp.]|nr:hypothetical protein [Belnapia sp.]
MHLRDLVRGGDLVRVSEKLGSQGLRQWDRVATRGREKVVAWLKTLENHSAKRPAGDPIGDYDFGWMWRELGVDEWRR